MAGLIKQFARDLAYSQHHLRCATLDDPALRASLCTCKRERDYDDFIARGGHPDSTCTWWDNEMGYVCSVCKTVHGPMDFGWPPICCDPSSE